MIINWGLKSSVYSWVRMNTRGGSETNAGYSIDKVTFSFWWSNVRNLVNYIGSVTQTSDDGLSCWGMIHHWWLQYIDNNAETRGFRKNTDPTRMRHEPNSSAEMESRVIWGTEAGKRLEGIARRKRGCEVGKGRNKKSEYVKVSARRVRSMRRTWWRLLEWGQR